MRKSLSHIAQEIANREDELSYCFSKKKSRVNRLGKRNKRETGAKGNGEATGRESRHQAFLVLALRRTRGVTLGSSLNVTGLDIFKVLKSFSPLNPDDDTC